MDRCALFVDAGYVLADGAMAVHGTQRRESVSWDYGGLLQLLGNLAMERSGLPLLRCYWYESAADGRRSAEQEALADMPGVKLRLVKARPGHEGVEGEMHRDLIALARNQAVSDAMVVSSAEELTRVVADVQDLGMRVTLLHIAADGNWTISRTLRQECDDIVEITPALLRPYVELISGAEPHRPDEREGGALIALRPHANGHAPGGRTTGYAPMLPAAPNGNGHHDTPVIYTEPIVADYHRPALQIAPPADEDAPAPPATPGPPMSLAPPAGPPPETPPAPVPPASAITPGSVVPPGPPAPPAPPASDVPRAPAAPPAPLAGQPDSPVRPVQPPAGQDGVPGGDLLAGLAAMPAKRPDVPDARPNFSPAQPGAQPAGQPGPQPAPQPQEPAPVQDQYRPDQLPSRFARHEAPEARPEPPSRGDVVPLRDMPSGGLSPARDDGPAGGEVAARGNAPRDLPVRREFTAYQDLFAAPIVEAPPPAPLAPPPAEFAPPAPPPAEFAPAAPPRAQVAAPPPRDEHPAGQPVAAWPQHGDVSGYNPGALRDPRPLDPATPPHGFGPPPLAPQGLAPQGPGPGPQGPVQQPGLVQPGAGQPPAGQPPQPPGVGPDVPPAPTYTPGNGSYSGPQPAVSLRQVGTGPSPALSPNELAGGEPAAPAHAAPVQPAPAHAAQPGPSQPGPGQPMPAPHASVSAPHGPAHVAPVQDGFGPMSYEQPSYEEAPYEEPSYEQPAYEEQSYGQPEYPQPGYGQPEPGYGQPEFGQPEFNPPAAMGSPNPSGPLRAVATPGPGAPAGPGPMNPGGALNQPAPMNHQGNPGVPAAPGGPVQGVPAYPAAAPEPSISLADAVQSAHEEGQEFGGSVARDAPTLWLEAVLARKPRMPSDLEARLLQGSSLPIDFLLHDEVRHALRRGFWDALERARR